MPRWQLVGLVEPATGVAFEDFRSWYLDHHVEDTVSCPGFGSARVLGAVRPFAGTTPPGYITVYEVEAETPERAERVLARYQRDTCTPISEGARRTAASRSWGRAGTGSTGS